MSPKDAAYATRHYLKPKYAIPMHYGTIPSLKGTPEEYIAALGKSTTNWTWGQAHTVTHGHPMGLKKPLHLLFNVGPFPAPGGRELPNYFAFNIGPAPWPVHTGPSTRRVIDFADAGKSLGINPVGQSGVLFDRHHHDQAQTFIGGGYQPQHLEQADVKANTRSTLTLQPTP